MLIFALVQGEAVVEMFALLGAWFCSLGCKGRSKWAKGEYLSLCGFASMS